MYDDRRAQEEALAVKKLETVERWQMGLQTTSITCWAECWRNRTGLVGTGRWIAPGRGAESHLLVAMNGSGNRPPVDDLYGTRAWAPALST